MKKAFSFSVFTGKLLEFRVTEDLFRLETFALFILTKTVQTFLAQNP